MSEETLAKKHGVFVNIVTILVTNTYNVNDINYRKYYPDISDIIRVLKSLKIIWGKRRRLISALVKQINPL